MAITTANTQSTYSTTNASSFTLASYVVSAGTNRLLIAMVSLLRSNETGIAPTGVTFGGAAMTEAVASAGTSTSRSYYAGLWYLVAPAISTGSVVVTPGATMAGAIVAAATLYGVDQATPVSFTAAASETDTTAVFGAGSDFTVFLVTANSNNAPSWSWTANSGGSNPTEYFDLNNGNDNNEVAGSAAYIAIPLSTYYTATCAVTPPRTVGVVVGFGVAAEAGSLVLPRRPRTYIRM